MSKDAMQYTITVISAVLVFYVLHCKIVVAVVAMIHEGYCLVTLRNHSPVINSFGDCLQKSLRAMLIERLAGVTALVCWMAGTAIHWAACATPTLPRYGSGEPQPRLQRAHRTMNNLMNQN